MDESEAPDLDLSRLYGIRFAGEDGMRSDLWQVLCSDFFQRYVTRGDAVLDVAAGNCEFINNIRCRSKVAVDLSPALPSRAASDVRTLVTSATRMDGVDSDSIDVAFVSNFFEHISRSDILLTLREIRRVLKPEGRLLILQPNIRLCKEQYWRFFDHVTPLDEHSLAEALETSGFTVRETIIRFLPYTTKGRIPTSALLARVYLRLRPMWLLMGKQTFVVATSSKGP